MSYLFSISASSHFTLGLAWLGVHALPSCSAGSPAGSIAEKIVTQYGKKNDEQSSIEQYKEVVQQTFASLEEWLKASKKMTSTSIQRPRQIVKFVQIILNTEKG